VKKNGPEENLNKTNTGKQSRNKQFSCTGKFLSKRKEKKNKNKSISLYESRQTQRGFLRTIPQPMEVLKNQALLWCSSSFLPSLLFVGPYLFPYCSVSSLLERVEESEGIM